MSTDSQFNYLLLGLPEAGKTTFLAALWYMVNQSAVDCAFHLERLDGDITYLNEIRSAWLEYRPVQRNLMDTQRTVSMLLRDQHVSAPLRLTAPDLSGESFSLQWSERQLTAEYDARLREASGALLFIHPDHVTKPHRIDMADAIVAEFAIRGTENQPVPAPIIPKIKPQEWNPDSAPTQVKLVEILQFISSRPYFSGAFRLAVVVSAWDRLASSGRTVLEWVTCELPLLRAFLDANGADFLTHYYGISAQGGRYSSPLLSTQNILDPQRFVTVLSTDGIALSKWIWQLVNEDVRTKLSKGDLKPDLSRQLLAQELNHILARPPIFDESLFAGVAIREETHDMLAGRRLQPGNDFIRVNRLLLEDAYPDDISRDWQYAEEASALQNKIRAHRVLITGDDVINEHDITEPIQWLVRGL